MVKKEEIDKEQKTTKKEIIKLQDEEINDIQEIMKQYQQLIYSIGESELKIQKEKLEKDKLLDNYKKNNQKADKIIQNLKNKYGNGSVDMQSWTFIKE
jgi:hypothetical protein